MQKNYGNRYAIAYPGFLDGLGEFRARPLRNSATYVQDTWTIAVPGSPDASGTYSVTVNGVTASATTDASATQAELETALMSAIRASAIYDTAFPVLDTSAHVITLKSRAYGVAMTVTVNSGATTADLVLTHTVTPAAPSAIGFGCGVVRKAGDPADECRLPSATTDKFLGVALSTYAVERDAIGPNAKSEYKANDMLDAVYRTTTGIWVPVVDLDITRDDAVYLVCTGATAGYFTKSSSGTIAVPSAAFVSNTEASLDGKNIALLSVLAP